jgi:hypothetical protein
MARGDEALRTLYKSSLALMMNRRLKADPGNLLVMLDSYDFTRFLARYRSPQWEENTRFFRGDVGEESQAMQWENEKALRRSARMKDTDAGAGRSV